MNPHNRFQSIESQPLTHMNGPIIKLAIENRKELFSDDLLNYTLEKKKTGQLDL